MSYRDSLGNRYHAVPGAKVPPGSRGSKKGRKHGRKARQPAFIRWKDRWNRGQALKHRRANAKANA